MYNAFSTTATVHQFPALRCPSPLMQRIALMIFLCHCHRYNLMQCCIFPDFSWQIYPPGSRSASAYWMGIRIHICILNVELYKFLKRKFSHSPLFLNFEQSLMFFTTCESTSWFFCLQIWFSWTWIRICIKYADADPDPHSICRWGSGSRRLNSCATVTGII